jgi:hypothetical protein
MRRNRLNVADVVKENECYLGIETITNNLKKRKTTTKLFSKTENLIKHIYSKVS